MSEDPWIATKKIGSHEHTKSNLLKQKRTHLLGRENLEEEEDSEESVTRFKPWVIDETDALLLAPTSACLRLGTKETKAASSDSGGEREI